MTTNLIIASLYLIIATTSHNYNIISHNRDFISHNCDFISLNCDFLTVCEIVTISLSQNPPFLKQVLHTCIHLWSVSQKLRPTTQTANKIRTARTPIRTARTLISSENIATWWRPKIKITCKRCIRIHKGQMYSVLPRIPFDNIQCLEHVVSGRTCWSSSKIHVTSHHDEIFAEAWSYFYPTTPNQMVFH